MYNLLRFIETYSKNYKRTQYSQETNRNTGTNPPARRLDNHTQRTPKETQLENNEKPMKTNEN